MVSIKYEEQWVEVFAVLFLAIGFVIAVLLRNPVLSYFTVFLGGFVAARIYFAKRFTQPILPFVLIIIGFLLGFLLGSFWTSRITTFLLFFLGFLVSYYMHMKRILVTFKSKQFMK